MARCEAQTAAGQPCQAYARAGRQHCFHHDAASARQRAAARSRGGRARCRPAAVLPGGTPDAPLASPADVAAFLA
jgi:hypothetical protein